MPQSINEESTLKQYIAERLASLIPILQKVAMGDFSEEIEIPENEY